MPEISPSKDICLFPNFPDKSHLGHLINFRSLPLLEIGIPCLLTGSVGLGWAENLFVFLTITF